MCTYTLLYKNKIFNCIFSISTFHVNSGIYHTYSKLFYVHSICVPTPPWGNLQGTAAFIYPSTNGKITRTNTSVNTQGKTVSLEAIITSHLAFREHIQLLSTGKTLRGSALETVICAPHCPAEQHTHCLSFFPPIFSHAPAQLLPEQICLLILIGWNFELCLFNAVLWQSKALCMIQQYLEKEGVCPVSEKIHLFSLYLFIRPLYLALMCHCSGQNCSLDKWKIQPFPPVREHPLALLHHTACLERAHTDRPQEGGGGNQLFLFKLLPV